MKYDRLPNINVLNGSLVKAEERKEAEKDFLSFFIGKEDKPERYFELLKIHGKYCTNN